MPDRVRTRREFDQLAQSRRRGASGPLRIVFAPPPEGESGIRGAYAISKKVGNAVQRNRIRRRLRTLLDEVGGHVQPGYYLIKCGIETGSLNYDELRQHLERAIERATRGA